MPVVSDIVAGYRVEVSGWDSNQDFFVEKADLQWSERFGKHLLLSRPVPPGTLLFLRFLDPTSLDRVHPIPYCAEPIASSVATEEGGRYRVRLLPARRQRMDS